MEGQTTGGGRSEPHVRRAEGLEVGADTQALDDHRGVTCSVILSLEAKYDGSSGIHHNLAWRVPPVGSYLHHLSGVQASPDADGKQGADHQGSQRDTQEDQGPAARQHHGRKRL